MSPEDLTSRYDFFGFFNEQSKEKEFQEKESYQIYKHNHFFIFLLSLYCFVTAAIVGHNNGSHFVNIQSFLSLFIMLLSLYRLYKLLASRDQKPKSVDTVSVIYWSSISIALPLFCFLNFEEGNAFYSILCIIFSVIINLCNIRSPFIALCLNLALSLTIFLLAISDIPLHFDQKQVLTIAFLMPLVAVVFWLRRNYAIQRRSLYLERNNRRYNKEIGKEYDLLKIEMNNLIEQRNRDLKDAKKAAEIANQAKNQFLASMSHELRTPLNAIIGFSDIMMNGHCGPLEEGRFKTYCHSIHDSGQNLLKVVNNILDISALDNGTLYLEEEEVDVVELMTNVLFIYKTQLDYANLELDFEVQESLPNIMADSGRLMQIVNALISNAVKFSESGKTVTIHIENKAEDGFHIVIMDEGIGMNDAELALAKEPFRQVDGRLERKYDGIGLGLPLAYSLSQLHGAALEIDSVQGQGTTARLIFPEFRVL